MAGREARGEGEWGGATTLCSCYQGLRWFVATGFYNIIIVVRGLPASSTMAQTHKQTDIATYRLNRLGPIQ